MAKLTLFVLISLITSASFAQLPNPFLIGNEPGSTCSANINVMENQIHRDRAAALKTAREDLLNDKTVDQKKALSFLDQVSTVALAEGDQGNTAFTRDGLVKAYKSYSGSQSALNNYLGILKTYATLLKDPKQHLTAGSSTMALATEQYIYQVRLSKIAPSERTEKKKKEILDDAKALAAQINERGCMGEQNGQAVAVR